MEPALVFEDVSVLRWDPRAKVRRALVRGVDWRVAAGEHWALLGPNGAGKTTLLRIASAQLHPTSGVATILGGTLGRVSVPALRSRIGVVSAVLARRFNPQRLPLDVVLSGVTGTIDVLEERLTPADVERAHRLLELVHADALVDRPLADCSEGERTRVMLARALATDATLLVLDEPASGLDLAGRELLLGALERLHAERAELATVMATQHVEELPPTTTHALLLRGGEVVAAGPAGETLTGEQLGACFGIPARVERVDGRYLARAAAR